MMKNLMRVRSVWCAVLSAAMVSQTASAWAEFEVVDGVAWYYSISSGKATITSGNIKYAGNLKVPSSLGECPVTGIGDSAFNGCNMLTSVIIPAGVTSIGGWAFSDCGGLKSVAIPEGVTSIGSYAFYRCNGLKSVAIPEGVTCIGSYAFSDCSGLTSVTIPSSVTNLGSPAFDGCSGLTTIVVDVANPRYKSIDNCLLSKDGMTLIRGPDSRSVMIPKSVTNVESYAFSGCSGLVSVSIPFGVTSIGACAFYACSGLRCVTIPAGVTSIEAETFLNCSGLFEVRIPDTVVSISPGAFAGCTSIRRLTIPASVILLPGFRRYGFSWPQEIEFLGAPPNGIGDSGWLGCDRISYTREHGAEWQKIVGADKFSGFGGSTRSDVAILSAAIRENDPTVMDVVYKVTSTKPTVKVRALAFQDGERSFAKVVRPTGFIEDTAKNIGDEVAANAEHTLSWRVSADWKVDLAKVKFEVLVLDGDLLSLELTTIPRVGNHAAMEISWNAITKQQVLDALLWLYADGDEGLTVENGVLKHGTTQLVSSDGLWTAAMRYVYSKMGFSVLSGDELKYANDLTRLRLSPDGVRQYAYRVEKEDGTWGPADGGEDDEGNEPIVTPEEPVPYDPGTGGGKVE